MKDELVANLRRHVGHLAGAIGPRGHEDTDKLNKAADYIESQLRSCGCIVERRPFEYKGATYYNVIGSVKGYAVEPGAYVIGAHYDTVAGSPGADDNASGVAGMLEFARLTSRAPMACDMIFAGFSLEEPPVFRTRHMGSMAYARELKAEGAKVLGMLSLEMIGYYADINGSQFYPLPFMRWLYPSRGDYIAFVGNIKSRGFTKEIKRRFRACCNLPVESLNTSSAIPGVDFSDHRSFWKSGHRAFMVTDTAFYRNPHYHGPTDLPDTLDYIRMAVLVRGLYCAFKQFAAEPACERPLPLKAAVAKNT